VDEVKNGEADLHVINEMAPAIEIIMKSDFPD